MMIDRRQFALSLGAALSAPALLRAQSGGADALREAVSGLGQMHAILVHSGDDVILEDALRGPGLDRVANIKSCSKSLVGLLLGEMISAGTIPSVDARLGDVAPSIIPSNATEGVADLTMEDLVTLRMGLERTSGGNYGAWVSSRDWVGYALSRERISENGGRMLYSTGTTHVLGAALATAADETLLTLMRRHLGTPLGIEIPSWTRDPQGFYFGGNEMALTPRDMLRVARAMRDGGQLDGEQALSADWIAASQEPRTQSPYSGLSYGYGWFMSGSGWTLARGYGGQIIAAHAERGLAVAITSDPMQPARSGGYFGDLMRLLDGPILSLSA